MIGEIIFNNKSTLEDLNLKLTSYPTIPLSSEKYSEISIKGRKGALIENNGTYDNKHVTFEFTKKNDDEMLNFDDIYDWLLNIKDNRFIYWQTDRCLIVKKVEFKNFKQEYKRFGTITIEFVFAPFWEDTETITNTIETSDKKIMYYGTAPTAPIITVYGNGNLQLSINDEVILIKDVENYIVIDNELMQVRNEDGTSKDFDTIGNFVEFEKGVNTVKFSDNVTKVIITYKNKWRG